MRRVILVLVLAIAWIAISRASARREARAQVALKRELEQEALESARRDSIGRVRAAERNAKYMSDMAAYSAPRVTEYDSLSEDFRKRNNCQPGRSCRQGDLRVTITRH